MKKIGNTKYVHYTDINSLTKEELDLLTIAEHLLIKINRKAFRNHEVIKMEFKKNTVTFIESPDWNTASEPTVGDSHKIIVTDEDPNVITHNIHGERYAGIYRKRVSNMKQIYHHKWMFVCEGYTEFDMEEAKAWSKKWTSTIPKGHAKKYGYREYWENLLKEYGLK